MRFALLGHGYHLCKFAAMLPEPPVIVTHPKAKHQRDKALMGAHPDLYEYLFDGPWEIIEADNVNGTEQMLLDRECTMAFSLSCRSIIRKPFIDAFGGLVFNIHPTMLPRERGGGTYSYRILLDDPHVSATIHYIDEGIDTGNIILQKERIVPGENLLPADYIRETNKLYVELLETFLEHLPNDGSSIEEVLPSYPQDETKSSYLPRLFTDINGAIDWSWGAEDIARFIRAFAFPYPGAWTYKKNQIIKILAVEVVERPSHPFLSGRVVKREGEWSTVLVRDGGLRIKSDLPLNFMDILYTPDDLLMNSKTTIPRI